MCAKDYFRPGERTPVSIEFRPLRDLWMHRQGISASL
jgi:hypothetical protein